MSLVADKLTDAGMEGQMNGIGIVVFNVPLDTLSFTGHVTQPTAS